MNQEDETFHMPLLVFDFCVAFPDYGSTFSIRTKTFFKPSPKQA